MNVYRLKIELLDDECKTSTLLDIPEHFTFADLHYAIQMFSNWWCEHFAYFVGHKEYERGNELRKSFFDKKNISQTIYFSEMSKLEEISDTKNSDWVGDSNFIEWRTKTLDSYFNKDKTLHYYYDTGDGWECLIELIETNMSEVNYPIVIKNTGIWPAEDSRGRNLEINKAYTKAINDKNITIEMQEILEWAIHNGWTETMNIAVVNIRLKDFFILDINERIFVYDNDCLIDNFFNPFSNVSRVEQLLSHLYSRKQRRN